MPYPINTSEISRLTGATRETVLKKVAGLSWTQGEYGARLYDSKAALRCIFLGDGQSVSAQDRLADTRTEQIQLQMESERKKRIPLEDVEEHNETVLQNCAGIFKANEGKKLTPELIQEIFAELRRMGEVLTRYCRRGSAPEKEADVPGMDDPMFQ